jgi:hypothetical protein
MPPRDSGAEEVRLLAAMSPRWPQQGTRSQAIFRLT